MANRSYKEQALQGFLQALAVTIYCSFVAAIFLNAEYVFGNVPNQLGFLLMLVLFSVSVLVCGILVFYKPYKMFFEDKRKAADVVLYTGAWLLIFFLILLIAASFIRVR